MPAQVSYMIRPTPVTNQLLYFSSQISDESNWLGFVDTRDYQIMILTTTKDGKNT